jgi:hypothetical protein
MTRRPRLRNSVLKQRALLLRKNNSLPDDRKAFIQLCTDHHKSYQHNTMVINNEIEELQVENQELQPEPQNLNASGGIPPKKENTLNIIGQ